MDIQLPASIDGPYWVKRLNTPAWPFDPAAGRFLFGKLGHLGDISVYYDDRNALGIMPKPYFEIYPNKDGDTERFYPEERHEMIQALMEAADQLPVSPPKKEPE